MHRMIWRIVARTGASRGTALPAGILTVGPGFRHESMPDEIALLLPSNAGPKRLLDAVVAEPDACAGGALGLFLASPFLDVEREAARLARAGVRWIVNLPGVAQQDEEFVQQLTDVGLDLGRELDRLAQFQRFGFDIAVVVADGGGAAAAAAIDPRAIIVLPKVADFAAGFPSLRQRGAAVQAVAEAASGGGWSGPLLGLADRREAEHEALWPDRLDAVVCRPEPA